MRFAASLLSAPGAPALASLLAALTVALDRAKMPPARTRPQTYSLAQRVRVALQAAARARR